MAAAARERQPLPLGRQLERPRRRAASDVGAPLARRRPALDRADHPSADDEDADVAAAMIDRALHVEDRPDLLERLRSRETRRPDR